MIRTGQQYRDSIRDGRRIWVNGERVDDVTVIYLEADPHVLIQRFKALRRPHPLSSSIARGIEEEKRRMEPLRERADHIIDTSKMTNYNLRIRLKSILI